MPALRLGSKTFFNQTSAPTGWTKATTNDDYTLRVVSGSSGGTLSGSGNFSTSFSSATTWTASATSAGGTADASMADLPAHVHTSPYYGGGVQTQKAYFNAGGTNLAYAPSSSGGVGSSGSGATHTHTNYAVSGGITGGPAGFEILYVDFILATKAS